MRRCMTLRTPAHIHTQGDTDGMGTEEEGLMYAKQIGVALQDAHAQQRTLITEQSKARDEAKRAPNDATKFKAHNRAKELGDKLKRVREKRALAVTILCME